jgi:serine/threonine protein kinase/tetratricopeptide (TPR) repeat protein
VGSLLHANRFSPEVGGIMAGDREAARKAREGIGVSTGDSSAPLPQPVPNLAGSHSSGVHNPDGASGGTVDSNRTSPVSPVPKSDADAATIIGVPAPSSSGSSPHPIFSHIGATIFHEGDVLGGRYEILKLLGMGGMGAVYKARDMEVERIVALKVIRPDLAGNPAILARFKQELVLARQITHKNIIRIYDLNEADGVKFITMEFVEGEDLRTILLGHGKLAPPEATDIMLQVCAGLEAAHAEGVIHRDLKPSNIMRDAAGRVVIMDFGLARTIQGDGMTQTGMMIGTMEYMSPEQAMGKDLDARSDEYSVGLIFYELLTGFMPFHAESAIASLVKRTQERAVPLVDVDNNIPGNLSSIVDKCLEREPAERFSTIQDLIDELEVWQGKKSRVGSAVLSQSSLSRAVQAPAKKFPVKWIAAGVAALAVAIGAVVGVRYFSHSAATATTAQQGPVTSLAIIPFYNASGDASLNWMGSSIAESLSADVGQSSHLRTVSLDRLQQVLSDLRVSPQSQLDLQTVRRIAEFTHADTVVFGQYEKLGDAIRIDATVADLTNDRTINVKTDVPNEQQLLSALDKLAGDLREKLAANPEILKDLQAHSQHVTTKSVPALRAYNEGLQLARAGENNQAVTQFEEATKQDPSFALAFSKLAQTYAALGYDDKAAEASRRAMELSDNLGARDRFLIQAAHATILHDTAKAAAAYQELAKVDPDDTDVEFSLAKLYEDANNYPEAKNYLAKVLASDPKYVAALLASGRVDIKANDPQSALDPLNKALSLAIQFDNQEQKGSILQALGIAYLDLNKTDDALHNFQQALEIRRKVGDQRGIATSLGQIGQIYETMGNAKDALVSYQEAVDVDRKIGDKNGLTTSLMNLGGFYLDHGKYDDGLKNTNEALQIARDTGDEIAQATLLLNIGNAHFSRGEYQDALTYFQQSYDIRDRLKVQDDATQSLHNLAVTNAKLGQYDTALSQYLKAMDAHRAAGDKNGAALESSDMGNLFAVQGRYDAALKAQLEAVNTFKQLNDRTYQMVLALAGYGRTLAAVGQGDQGQKFADEAVQLAADAKNDSATAEALNSLGDTYFYRGNYDAARQQYSKALQLATKSKLRDQIAMSKLNLARTDVAQGKSSAAVAGLKTLKQDTDSMGLKAASVEASLYLGEALLATNHADAAREELDSAVGRADKLGLRVQQAQAQYFLGKALAASGKSSEAVTHYREAVKILETISKQEGAGRVLERSDLKDIYREAMRSYQGGV